MRDAVCQRADSTDKVFAWHAQVASKMWKMANTATTYETSIAKDRRRITLLSKSTEICTQGTFKTPVEARIEILRIDKQMPEGVEFDCGMK